MGGAFGGPATPSSPFGTPTVPGGAFGAPAAPGGFGTPAQIGSPAFGAAATPGAASPFGTSAVGRLCVAVTPFAYGCTSVLLGCYDAAVATLFWSYDMHSYLHACPMDYLLE